MRRLKGARASLFPASAGRQGIPPIFSFKGQERPIMLVYSLQKFGEHCPTTRVINSLFVASIALQLLFPTAAQSWLLTHISGNAFLFCQKKASNV